MPNYSTSSLSKLSTCHGDLIRLFTFVVKHLDNTILEGHRDRQAQNKYYEAGLSKVQWPNGKHNKQPSRAVDSVPYPIRWPKDAKTFVDAITRRCRIFYYAGFVMGVAAHMNIKLRWGGDWNKDFDFRNDNFFDGVHFELED